ncbi:MAG TPA: hypothetical protein PLQ11_03465 [Beijerinckiaceae bacterium]|nr:hypothetical protein [Beijerinckiaceae bacterium]
MRPQPVPVLVVSGAELSARGDVLEAVLASADDGATLLLASGALGQPRRAEAMALPDGAADRLSGACLCCTGRDDLVLALEDVLRSVDNHRMRPIRRLVIAADRAADPAALAGAIRGHPYLSLRFAPVAVLAVAGSDDLTEGQAAFDRRRLAVADWLVVDPAVDSQFAETNQEVPRLLPNALSGALTAFWSGAGPAAGSRGQHHRRALLRQALRPYDRRS